MKTIIDTVFGHGSHLDCLQMSTRASPFIPTSVACLVFVLIHWALAWLSQHNDAVGWLIKGEKTRLFAEGKVIAKNLDRSLISEKDLLESLRLRLNKNSFEQVQEMFLERNGEISVVKKD